MQNALEADGYPIQIIGVNEAGFESGNENITEGRDLPWLQDTDEVNVWDLWEVAYRDVFVMDTTGIVRFRYNLTIYDISNPTYYDALYNEMVDLTISTEE